ncbi:MAG: MarR family transcriptional regulator [Sandaracinaceae bacterium]|nr:MarR family transcriptional regulator [Sandaracinaceae bacterium]
MTEPELPSREDPASEAILLALRRISRRVSLHSKQLARHAGLTLPQAVCLKVLIQHFPSEVTVAEIGHAARLSSPTVTGILDRLERTATRAVRDTVDRRRVYVRLTPAGYEKVSALPVPLEDGFARRFRALPVAEREAILASLERVVALMEEATEPELLAGTRPSSSCDGGPRGLRRAGR